jgi:molybdopterin-guanine dinucleotide biosynthesis protein
MNLVSISGARGSGKTTLIRRLTEHLAAEGLRLAVIENEEGQARYDADFTARHALVVRQIRGG